MENNFSKRRFYLNKRDKINSLKKNEKNENITGKTEYNINRNKIEIRNFKPISDNKTKIEQKYFENEFRKKKTNLFSDENEIKNNKNDNIVKNINYFTFSLHNEFLIGSNNYINTNNKINYNFPQNQKNNIYTKKSYNNSFEKIKDEPKKCFGTFNKNKINFNDDYNKDNNNNKNENNLISNIKFINNSSKEKVKKDYKWRYHYTNKKKEIIRIQSIWRGYYFRKIKIEYILSVFVKNLKIIINNKLKILYKKFLNSLKNNKNKKNKFVKSYNINLAEKYNNNNNKRHLSYNQLNQNIDYKNNINNIIPINKRVEINKNSNELKKLKNKYNNNIINIEKNKNDNDDDIFNIPIKIIYIPKKVSNNNNRYYYLKRITRIKKIKLESFIKFIKKKFYSIYFNVLKNKYNTNSILYKIKNLVFVIDSILKNHMKKYLSVYREKILDIKAKEEIKKKKELILLNEKENVSVKILINKGTIIKVKKSSFGLKRNIDKNIKVISKNKNNIINDIILENINESDNEEENKNKKNYYRYRRRNKEKPLKLLKKLVIKKNENNLRILNKYFNQWKNSNIFNEKKSKIKFRNMHSPDIQLRGNKKRHIKIKYSKALTSKTSLSSIKTERSNTSGILNIKKMKVRNIIVNSSDYQYLKHKTENNYNRSFKLSKIIKKIENRNIIAKCFKYWKKIKKIKS